MPRRLHSDLVAEDPLLAVREKLLKEQRLRSKKGKVKASDAGGAGSAAGVEVKDERDKDLEPPVDHADAVELVLESLAADANVALNSQPRVLGGVLALEVLELLFRAAAATMATAPNSDEATAMRALYTDEFLIKLATIVYSTWDAGPTTLLHKCRASLAALLTLSSAFNSLAAPVHLRSRILSDPFLNKRSLNSFELLLSTFSPSELYDFSGVSKTGKEGVGAGVLRRFTEGMAESDEIATLAGRVASGWVEKVWGTEEGKADAMFWIQPIVDVIQDDEKGRNNVCLYLLPGLFKARATAFKELMTLGGFLPTPASSTSLPRTETSLSAALAILKVGNSMGLLLLAGTAPPPPPNTSNSAPKKRILPPETTVTLPIDLLSTCLYHASPSLRCAALSLLVHNTQASAMIPDDHWDLLKTFYTYSMGEEEGEFRMASIAMSGKLLLRLRDSSGKAAKRGGEYEKAYVAKVQAFVQWWADTLLFNLNPAKPFRMKMNALRLLDLLFQAHVDPAFDFSEKGDVGGYSSYRKTAPTATPQFQAKHKRVEDGSGGWPFVVKLVTPESTFNLLRLLLSTYTALRTLSISLLERFPSPLPGYEGDAGGEKAKAELLVPALKMVRSGRESESSAGAGIVGLVWRKWVLEGEVKGWDLSEIAGWKLETRVESGEGPFAFLNSLMDLAESQLAAHASDLGRAASTTPMHGTLLALRHLFVSIPVTSFASLSTPEARRKVFLRALAIVEKVWEVTSPVLAASAPEGVGVDAVVVDTEEARALVIEGGTEAEGVEEEEAEGSGGPMHKIILSATWRAMKEASELLETILRLPSELGAEAFQAIWSQAEVEHVGDLFASWLARIRHRGAFMAIHPCYSRACSALLVCKDWPQIQSLPVAWLNVHLESIISKKISITRRSAGLPYCILGILTAVLPTDKPTFDAAFVRLFEIAESKTDAITDESRVHAMNTLRTTFLDAKASLAVAPYIERGFLLAISLFWSPNWIIRNPFHVNRLLSSALITRAFNSRRTNLARDSESLLKRLTIDDFFGRYPSLHAVLLKELDFSTKEHLNDLPTFDLNSSLFSVLMLLSLMQTPNRVGTESPSTPFLPYISACSKSRVWKIRDAAGDALTGLVPPSDVVAVCLGLLDGVETCPQNEIHGRLVQVLRLLEGSGPLSGAEVPAFFSKIDSLTTELLEPRHSFAVRTSFLSITRVCSITSGYRSSAILERAYIVLEGSRSAPPSAQHLPSSENHVTAAFLFALAHSPSSASLISAGLESHLLEVQRNALSQLELTDGDHQALLLETKPSLIGLASSSTVAAECRIMALNLLQESQWSTSDSCEALAVKLLEEHSTSPIVPLREALLPVIARLVSVAKSVTLSEKVLKMIEDASDADESIESREAAAQALGFLDLPSIASTPEYARALLRLLQDDDPTVRGFAAQVATRNWSEGVLVTDRKNVELVLRSVAPSTIAGAYEKELANDVQVLSNPSSLLFAIERPNIFLDDLLETEMLTSVSPTTDVAIVNSTVASLSAVLGTEPELGPLGRLGNDLVCKWAFRALRRKDLAAGAPPPLNEVLVPLVAPSLQAQLFPPVSSTFAPLPPSDEAIRISKDHLRDHGLLGPPAPDAPPKALPPATDFKLPRLQGETISHHFYALGYDSAEPHLSLAKSFATDKLPPMPDREVWRMEPGWTHYHDDGFFEAVEYPPLEDDTLVFDVETLPHKASHFPILAVAVGKSGWYGWCSPWLTGADDSPNHLIPLGPKDKGLGSEKAHDSTLIEDPNEKPRLLIGHNVLFDRARVGTEYTLRRPATRWIDTMSLHVAIAGLTNPQRPQWMQHRKQEREKAEAEEEKLKEEGKTPAKKTKKDKPSTEKGTGLTWKDVSSVNSLVEVALLHCGITVDKALRDVLVDPDTTLEEVREHFTDLMSYCASDVFTTLEVYRAVLPKFLNTCPHPVSFAGVLSMSQPFLPVDRHWPQYLERSDRVYDERSKKVEDELHALVEQTKELAGKRGENGRFVWEDDLWLRQLDWSPKKARRLPGVAPAKKRAAKLPQTELPAWYAAQKPSSDGRTVPFQSPLAAALLRMTWRSYPIVHSGTHGYLFAVSSAKMKKYEPIDGEEPITKSELTTDRDDALLNLSGYELYTVPSPNGRMRTLLSKGNLRLFKSGKLAGLTPEVEDYASLGKNAAEDPEIATMLSTLAKEAAEAGSPKAKDALALTLLDWRPESVAIDEASPATASVPAKVKSEDLVWPQWYWDLDIAGIGLDVSVKKRAMPLVLRLLWKGFPLAYSKAHGWMYRVPNDQVDEFRQADSSLTPVEFDSVNDAQLAEDDAAYFKLPHPDGEDKNVGQPLSKSFVEAFEKGTLSSIHPAAADAIALNASGSYWASSRERISDQIVVWEGDAKSPVPTPDAIASGAVPESSTGLILPQVRPMGTITRRAVEATWLTASNAKKNRVGSELKSMIRAPPGYAIVGADVDSEELWICSVMGDAQFGIHGATAIGWMGLEGTKSAGTDLHSKSGSILGISRDSAKVFNYSRIYGAGVKHATTLLLKSSPGMSKDRAEGLAKNLYASTKGLMDRSESFNRKFWHGGSESFVFNKLEGIAHSDRPTTPVLGCGLTDALAKKFLPADGKSKAGEGFLPSRINWVVQSSGVDYLHLLIVSMEYLAKRFGIDARYMISVHDEIRYLVKEEDKYRAAMALQVANVWTRALFSFKLQMGDLPQSCAFFSAVDIDHCFRKEVNMTCVTPSNPDPIPFGESLDIDGSLAKTFNGSLFADGRSMDEDSADTLKLPRELSPKEVIGEQHRVHQVEFLTAQTLKSPAQITRLWKSDGTVKGRP
ncbi:DNA polymerase gamma subunit 1 [Pseudohyphozyma bogoriensis]|nr:DNA polymerase gamma subunit 1 [Pseudohyphozyma bogoriensis]